ncbi:MAG: laccase domain-containing protein [Chlorobi bacterium]|nr:laccase domain-containing protein [Chlorobiota bacterium]
MKIYHSEKTDILRFNLFPEQKIKHFISSRIYKTGNSVNSDFNISLENKTADKKVINNRKILSESVSIPLENFVMQNQVHGNNITIIDETYKGRGVINHKNAVQNSDAMITDKKNICLFLFAADCMPVLFCDIKKHIIAAAHSGWQGTVKKIVQKTAYKMIEIYNSNPNDIIVGIGPSISVKNYEVGENVVSEVEKAFGTKDLYLQFNKTTGKYHFDMWYAA